MAEMQKSSTSRKRAFIKIAVIIVLAVLAISTLAFFINDRSVEQLQHNFSLWTIIALVMIINLVSFLCFIMLYLAYRWVRADLKPGEDDELDF